jgi:hypothetical protein
MADDDATRELWTALDKMQADLVEWTQYALNTLRQDFQQAVDGLRQDLQQSLDAVRLDLYTNLNTKLDLRLAQLSTPRGGHQR